MCSYANFHGPSTRYELILVTWKLEVRLTISLNWTVVFKQGRCEFDGWTKIWPRHSPAAKMSDLYTAWICWVEVNFTSRGQDEAAEAYGYVACGYPTSIFILGNLQMYLTNFWCPPFLVFPCFHERVGLGYMNSVYDIFHTCLWFPKGIWVCLKIWYDIIPEFHGLENHLPQQNCHKCGVCQQFLDPNISCCSCATIWRFPKVGVSENGLFIRENPI